MHWPDYVDIAIVNYHSAEEIRDCLDALGPWKHGHIWIVDNSCDVNETESLRQLTSCRAESTVLTADENLGFGRGCNLALERSSSEYLLLLNPDARIAPKDLETLLQTLARTPDLGAVSPATYWNAEKSFVLPRPSVQTPLTHLGHVVATWWASGTRSLAERWVLRTRQEMASSKPVHVDSLAGAVLLLRRSAIDAAGGLFDPAYFMFFEDADLSIRLRRCGYGLALVPTAQAVHNYRHKPFKAELMATSQSLYFDLRHRWYFRLSGKLRGLEQLARRSNPPDWFDVLGTLNSAHAFSVATQGARVEAFSPSPLMMPAIARPASHLGKSFTPEEWHLLEPGTYVAWLSEPTRARWVHFSKGHVIETASDC